MIMLACSGLGASRVLHPRWHPDEPDCSTAAALANFQDNSGTEIYRHCRVVFRICPSLFQLSACIDYLLENSPARFNGVTQKLKHSFYVDDCVTGVNDVTEQENFIVKTTEIMARGCFNFWGWESTVPGRYIYRSSLELEQCYDPFNESILWKSC
ncbi:integrase catalytic domain-containing protein [Trichonephila clavata]|uniref:Integrase catalytic domain-containing protein n=1 Tax=Trichonephila clavata TaxID=2740835 RepID=A0A8X6GV03_TRICU|nr:integrase catalytic domain-containing protein [Trichonephila clavata]